VTDKSLLEELIVCVARGRSRKLRSSWKYNDKSRALADAVSSSYNPSVSASKVGMDGQLATPLYGVYPIPERKGKSKEPRSVISIVRKLF
jgi:hypothetical protein